LFRCSTAPPQSSITPYHSIRRPPTLTE
jgi:hypothetical protein